MERYAMTHDVPVNVLLAQGYRSISDWHSTEKSKEGESERSGHWYGREKTTAMAVATSSNAGLHEGGSEQVSEH